MDSPTNNATKRSQQSPPRRSGRPPMSPMVRGVVDHPLSKKNAEAPSQSVGTPVSTTYTASLVQSAAKSLIDNPSSTVSDDDEDSLEETPPSPGLESLLTKTVPALPGEQDRKRFIGCLASVLASSYDYDSSFENDEDDATNMSDSFAYYDDSDDGNLSDNDGSDLRQSISRSSTNSSLDRTPQTSEYGEIGISDEIGKTSRLLGSTRSIQRKNSLRSTSGSERASRSRDTSNQHSRKNGRRQNKKDAATELAQSRHRLRRYQIFSDLLISASELLLLDRSQAKAFLPMLDRLLLPNPSKKPPPNSPTQKGQRRASPQRSQSMPASPTSERHSNTQSGLQVSSHVSISSMERLDESACEFVQNPPSVVTDSPQHSTTYGRGWNKISVDCMTAELDKDESLQPFLESLSPGSGFRCLALLLMQQLLHSTVGYDARVRHAFKKLGVIVLVQEMKRDACDLRGDKDGEATSLSNAEYESVATRKFESLEHTIAWKLLHLSSESQSSRRRSNVGSTEDQSSTQRKGVSREQLVRGLKIGSAGLVAGTLFAVTGGLAAPGIAAGIAAVAGSSAATAAVVTLTSSAAITAMFGVGGGGLAAYKMRRRTQGLTEFQFQKESGRKRDYDGRPFKKKVEAELFTTICLSGWLRNECDFQRPWGVTPSNPKVKDLQELLERFYAIHKPDYITRASTILKRWKGQERELWQYLRETYGSDPSHLFPLDDGPRHQAALTHEQTEVVGKILFELGFSTKERDSDTSMSPDTNRNPSTNRGVEDIASSGKSKSGWRQKMTKHNKRGGGSSSQQASAETSSRGSQRIRTPLSESFRRFRFDGKSSNLDHVSHASSGLDNSTLSSESSVAQSTEDRDDKEESTIPKHIATVWDYQANYGGEQYTVKWESKLLLELSDSVEDLALDMMGGATAHVLKQTVLSTLLSAMALPYVLVNAANLIDGTWTLAIERSEEAGKELARSLLLSRAGYRPVVLVGFSMGARTIYTCLKELARYQEHWEELRQNKSLGEDGRTEMNNSGNRDDILEVMREPASIVEDVILMGMPNHLSLSSWAACRRVVAGRLVNCYSRKDLVLSLMFKFKRLSGGFKPVCGTCPVEIDGVENVDVSDLVSSHQDYCIVTGDILKRVRHGQPFRQRQSQVTFEAADDVAELALK